MIFIALFYLTMRRGVTDQVCGMKVDPGKAIRRDFAGETYYFCSEHCLHAFEVNPDQYVGMIGRGKGHAVVHEYHGH